MGPLHDLLQDYRDVLLLTTGDTPRPGLGRCRLTLEFLRGPSNNAVTVEP